MKKILLLLSVVALLLTGCTNTNYKKDYVDLFSFNEVKEEADRLNTNSNLSYDLLEVVDDELATSFSKDELNCVGEEYYNCFAYAFYDEANDNFIIKQIHVASDEYDVYGIKIGDSKKDAMDILSNAGFNFVSDENMKLEYSKNGVLITCILSSGEGFETVNNMKVSLFNRPPKVTTFP